MIFIKSKNQANLLKQYLKQISFKGNIEFGIIGDYKIEVVAIDNANNSSKTSFLVRVIDNSVAPIIKFYSFEIFCGSQ